MLNRSPDLPFLLRSKTDCRGRERAAYAAPAGTSAGRSDLPEEPSISGMVGVGPCQFGYLPDYGVFLALHRLSRGGSRIPAEAAALGDSRHQSFGCGVLISAVAYDLLEDGFQEGGIVPIIGGAIAGSVAYAVADWLVSKSGGHHRKQSGNEQQHASEGGGLAIAIGSLLDGIPESIVLGLLAGHGVSLAGGDFPVQLP